MWLQLCKSRLQQCREATWIFLINVLAKGLQCLLRSITACNWTVSRSTQFAPIAVIRLHIFRVFPLLKFYIIILKACFSLARHFCNLIVAISLWFFVALNLPVRLSFVPTLWLWSQNSSPLSIAFTIKNFSNSPLRNVRKQREVLK